MKRLILIIPFLLQTLLFGQQSKTVVFPTADGGEIIADFYPAGNKAVVLAHGAIFNKESWSSLAVKIARAGVTVLAINFRGYGDSQAGKRTSALEEDVLGALHYLHRIGYDTVSVLGASMGGGASARAAVKANPGQLFRLILLSPVSIPHPQKMRAGEIIYIASKKEGMAVSIQEQYEQAPPPKKIYWIEGSAHAQHIFKTGQGEKLTRLILALLKE